MWDVTGGRVVAQRCVGIVSYLTATMCLVLLPPLPWYPTCVVVPVIVVVMVAEQVAMRTVVQASRVARSICSAAETARGTASHAAPHGTHPGAPVPTDGPLHLRSRLYMPRSGGGTLSRA